MLLFFTSNMVTITIININLYEMELLKKKTVEPEPLEKNRGAGAA